MKRYFVVLLALTCFASDLPATPGQVLIVRHAEKPNVGDTLSKQGFQRAAAYVPYFTKQPAPFEMLTPVAVYARTTSKNHTSTRPIQTVSALANYWGVPFIVRYTSDDYKPMVSEIMNTSSYDSQMVLICWDHEHIPGIAHAFGVQNPPSWDESVYDRVWVINFSGDSVASFDNIPQQLMYGDSTN